MPSASDTIYDLRSLDRRGKVDRKMVRYENTRKERGRGGGIRCREKKTKRKTPLSDLKAIE
jgi:hypothetical protein